MNVANRSPGLTGSGVAKDGLTPPHRSPPFAGSRPMARSLARSTARAALRLLSSLRRFLFDLVMDASLHQLHCYPEASPARFAPVAPA